MANVVKHRFVSGKTNGPDATQVQPSNWNDGHAFAGGNQGDFLTRDATDATFGAKWSSAGIWTTYAPVWSTSADPQPFGHGITGKYTTIGKTCHFEVIITLFGGSGYGSTGIYQVSLPLPSAMGSLEAIGSMYMLASLIYSGAVATNGTNAIVAISGTTNWWGPGNPVVMAPGNTIKLQGCYEIVNFAALADAIQKITSEPST